MLVESGGKIFGPFYLDARDAFRIQSNSWIHNMEGWSGRENHYMQLHLMASNSSSGVIAVYWTNTTVVCHMSVFPEKA